jgi:peroxiredoxin
MVPLGFRAPDFALLDVVSGRERSLAELRGDKGTLVMFICNHCPYVKHINAALVKVARDFVPRGVSFIAISSNDAAAYPDDSPEQMRLHAAREGYPFPYLYDETQEVARAYNAVCTPDFFLFNADLLCVYRGEFDDSRPNNGVPVSGAELRAALKALCLGEEISLDQKPSLGCNIKWKPA